MAPPLRTKRLPTTDDWHPNGPRNTVECCVYRDDARTTVPRRGPVFRVTVWGADDTGMEAGFSSEKDAYLMYDSLPNPITMEWLRQKGFQNV